ncbi:MAG: DUF3179 domain-containing protein [Candidatus Bipolaricaulia bacterium]
MTNRFALITGVVLLVMLLSWSGLADHQRIATEEQIATTERGTKYLSALELDQFLSLLPPDSIPSIDVPRFISAAEADEWLFLADLVMGVRHNGTTKVYPIRILNWHEVVNDDFDGEMVVVTYCPLCNSGVVFIAPELEGPDGELQIARFGTSGSLYKSDLIMYDRVTFSLWSQITGETIVGPLVGEIGVLHRIPVDLVPWGLWRDEHPNTIVLDRPQFGDVLGGAPTQPIEGAGLFPRDYDTDPYASYRLQNPEAGSSTSFGVPFFDERLQAKDDVIGIAVDGGAKAYAKTAFAELALLNDQVGETPILVVKTPAGELKFFDRQLAGREEPLEFELVDGNLVDRTTGSTWDFTGIGISGELSGTQLEEIVGVPAFWFAWVAFHPETELFGGAQ